MDENDFLRGIEGDQQNGRDLISGAEHLIRLKKQAGITRPSDDLDLEKEAGELAESLATPPTHLPCKNCGKAKTACVCGTEKMANPLRSILMDARIKMASEVPEVTSGFSAMKDAIKKHLSHPMARSAAVGGVVGGTIQAARGAAQSPEDRMGGAARGGARGIMTGAAGGALYHHLRTKLAESREKTANAIVDRLKDVNPGLVAATGMGALAGGIGTYLSSRPQKDTGKSKSEEDLEGRVEAQHNKPEDGLLSKMHNRNTELEHGYARAFREHPNKAALLGALTGAMGGYGIGRLAGGRK